MRLKLRAVPFLLLGLLLSAHFAGAADLDPPLRFSRCADISTDMQAVIRAAGRYRIFSPDSGKIDSVTLVVHGLNTQPAKMDIFLPVLLGENSEVFRVALEGHQGNLADFKKVLRTFWLNDFFESYCAAKSQADIRGVPLRLLGFSLGGLVATDLMNSDVTEPLYFDRAVLLAPALFLKPLGGLIRFFHKLLPNLLLPSFGPRSFRANASGTPIAAYVALYDSADALGTTSLRRSHFPTLIVMDPEDELLNVRETREQIRVQGLKDWTVISLPVEPDDLRRKPIHHFLIDPTNVGAAGWLKLTHALSAFLTRPASNL